MNDWRMFSERPELDKALAVYIADRLRQDIGLYGQAALALSGGSTPLGMLRDLSACPLDWSKVTVTLVDERWVPPEHPDSNERLLRDNLLQQQAASAQLVGLKTGHDSAEAGLQESRRKVAHLSRPFTLVILGMGGDGHTASWFPGARNLDQLLSSTGQDTLMSTQPPSAPHSRITLTLPAVLDSREIIIHITGEEKRAVLEAAPERGYPVAAVLKQAAPPVTVWWAP